MTTKATRNFQTALLSTLIFAASVEAATTNTVVDVASNGATQRFLYVRPDAPRATIISIPGGDGTFAIQNDGSMNTITGACGPISRNRQAYAERGFAVALVDRTSAGNAYQIDDIDEVVKYVRARDNVPVWVVGGSASTSAITNLALNLPATDPVGVIYFAPAQFSSSAVGQIRRPTQVIYHSSDQGQFGAQLFNALTSLSPSAKERVALSGGVDAGCLYHLFQGLDAEFVAATAGFIDAQNASLQTALNLQGLWWQSPAGSGNGWGVNISHQGDILFATWFTYGADGTDFWLVMDNAVKSGLGVYSGTIYQARSAPFSAYNPSQFVPTPVGSGTFTFTDANNGTFSYTVNGIAQTKPITRYVFSSPVPTCSQGGSQSASINYEDLWWQSPAGSGNGWGVNVSHQGDILFVTWFTYGADGTDLWMVMDSAAKSGNGVYSGTIRQARSSPFNAYDPAQFTAPAIGTGTFTFTDANNGTFAYTVNGIAQSKPITRFVFSSPTTTCRF